MQAKTAIERKVCSRTKDLTDKNTQVEEIVEYIKSYYICYTPIYIKVPVAF